MLTLSHIVDRTESAPHPHDRRRRVATVLASYRGDDGEYRKQFLLPRGTACQFAAPAILPDSTPSPIDLAK